MWASKIRMELCRRSDERLQCTQEALSAIKIVKIYVWEKFFQDRISETRRKEVNSIHKSFYLQMSVIVLGTLSSKVAFYVLIMTYVWLGNQITAEITYFVISCFQILSSSLSVTFPLGVVRGSELYASMERIGEVLEALDVPEPYSNQNINTNPVIVLKNASVNFKCKEILRSVDLCFDLGVNLVMGPVGSGKSFLLKTILRDFEPSSGKVVIHGRLSYASQEPWLFPSTIKQNIVFGERFDEQRYQEVLEVCALRYDLERLASGDRTIVEDRGTNLSKGQQARINLARTVYKDSEIYLLDDCLSAVDVNVCDYIFKTCIIGFLRNKLVILVTHNTSYLKDVDKVVILKKGGVMSVVTHANIDEFEVAKEIKTSEKEQQQKDVMREEEGVTESTKLITKNIKDRKRVYQEVQKRGNVSIYIYKKYILFGGGFICFLLVFLVFGVVQFTTSYSDKLVSQWVNIEEELSNFTVFNATDDPQYNRALLKRSGILQLYTFMVVASTFLIVARTIALLTFTRRASINIHNTMLNAITNAAMSFFDSNFIGNVLNRFSKDLSAIDEQIPNMVCSVLYVPLSLTGMVYLIASVNTIFLVPTAILLVLLIIVRRVYIPTGRSLKRLDAAARSPVIGHLNATLEGLTTIRAFKAESTLRNEFDRHQDLYTSASYTVQSTLTAFAFLIDIICAVLVCLIIFWFLVSSKDTLAGNVGLVIYQAFMMTETLQWGVREWAEVESQMTSVERVLEYTEIKQEKKDGQERKDWPKEGRIEYKNVNLTYPISEDKVLKNINFIMEPKQKLAVVGRTGAGKSSIISALFRLYDVDGTITIDGADTKTISLNYLRNQISIIPQDPVLFSGTIRSNIDPIGKFSDEDIWKAVEKSNLNNLVPSLDFEISEHGSNFSAGQRQLICMARAVIRNNKIVVLDEATASMDPETDALIDSAIDNTFKDCTVFTIAHKLYSMLKCDKVMLVDKGEIIELDDPDVLLRNKNGAFYNLVKKAGLLPDYSENITKLTAL